MSATRILDDIHIEATAILMRSRWKPPMWGPPEQAPKLREATPPPTEKNNEPRRPAKENERTRTP